MCGECTEDEDDASDFGQCRCCSLNSNPNATIKAIVNSTQDLQALLKGRSKISRLIQSPTKIRMKLLSELVPGIPCEQNEAVALVDSGSTINATWIKDHFAEYADRIIASMASSRGEEATTAGGHQLKNEGRCRVVATVDRHDFPMPFQNMQVDIPILIVRKYVKSGFSFHFSDEGDYMICNRN